MEKRWLTVCNANGHIWLISAGRGISSFTTKENLFHAFEDIVDKARSSEYKFLAVECEKSAQEIAEGYMLSHTLRVIYDQYTELELLGVPLKPEILLLPHFDILKEYEDLK